MKYALINQSSNIVVNILVLENQDSLPAIPSENLRPLPPLEPARPTVLLPTIPVPPQANENVEETTAAMAIYQQQVSEYNACYQSYVEDQQRFIYAKQKYDYDFEQYKIDLAAFDEAVQAAHRHRYIPPTGHYLLKDDRAVIGSTWDGTNFISPVGAESGGEA